MAGLVDRRFDPAAVAPAGRAGRVGGQLTGMGSLDYAALIVYFVGLLAVGVFTARRNETAGQMFAAGGHSPWWVAGLSAFMSMFSAGTFVVWGGIAYRHGFVAVAISLCYGVAAFVAGRYLAGAWNRLKLTSPAEFIELRFGRAAVQFYLWLQIVLAFGGGAAVYGLSKLLCALVPLPAGHVLADPTTGTLSVTLASVGVVIIVVVYTMLGGLWAVMLTDVLQFVILTVSVVFVVPLILARVGGPGEFLRQAPEGFLAPTTDEFTWFFLVLWAGYHVVIIGANWAFAQRFLAVPSPRDARRASYLFGTMYLLSPLFWMLPPMAYRLLNPAADHEQAYILACQLVLPAGMIGLMLAAMFSATASMADSSFNVMAGAVLKEVYQKLLRPAAGERELVLAGRVITVLLGLEVLAGAILIPRLGSYTGYVLALGLINGLLFLPTIWGLFSRRIGFSAVWLTTLIAGPLGLGCKFGLGEGGRLAALPAFQAAASWYQGHVRVADVLLGVGLPALVLLVLELTAKGEDEGWRRVAAQLEAAAAVEIEAVATPPDPLPLLMVAWMLGLLAGLMGVFAVLDEVGRGLLVVFAAVLAVLAVLAGGGARRLRAAHGEREGAG